MTTLLPLKPKGKIIWSRADGTYRNEHRKVGRNEMCPCGSNIKYKRCHGK